MVNGARLAGLMIFAAASVVAQKGGTSGGGTTGGGTTGGTAGGGTSSTSTSSTTTPNSTSSSTQVQRPVFVSGRVMVDGEDAPPERVAIERVCAGATYREGYTDSKGYFNLQLGANAGVFGDASLDTPVMMGNPGLSPMNGGGGSQNNNSNPMGNNLWSCELRASLGGYHSETVPLVSRRSMDNPDVGIIMLTRMIKVDGYTTSATIALAPKDVKKAYEKGLNFEKHAKPDEAQAEFLHAVEMYPKHAGAWFELGKVYEQRNHIDEARDSYQKAIAADANFVNPYERLYLLALHDNKWADAAEITAKVMHLNPYEFPAAYFYNALANVNLQNWDAAEKSAREAAKIRGTRAMPKSLFLLGLAQANKGDLPGSVETLHSYLQTDPVAADKERAQKLLGQVQQNLAAQNQTEKPPQ
jgi:tetratricopeptide (TPR) repeat protein